MILQRRKSTPVVGKLRGRGGRRKSKPAGVVDAVRDKLGRGPATTAQGVRMAGKAAGRHGKATAVYARRKASGKRAPLLVSLPLFVGASVTAFLAVRKMRRGASQTLST